MASSTHGSARDEPEQTHPSRRMRPRGHGGGRLGGDAEAAAGLPRQVGNRSASSARLIIFNVLVALFGPFLWPVDLNEFVVLRFEDPELGASDGTDEFGRDTLARIIHGAQRLLRRRDLRLDRLRRRGLLGLLAGYYQGISTRC